MATTTTVNKYLVHPIEIKIQNRKLTTWIPIPIRPEACVCMKKLLLTTTFKLTQYHVNISSIPKELPISEAFNDTYDFKSYNLLC